MVQFSTYFVVMIAVSILGIGASLATYRAINIRLWKKPVLYFTGAITAYGIHQTVAALEVFGENLFPHMVLETVFVGLTVIGVYRIKETAEELGQ